MFKAYLCFWVSIILCGCSYATETNSILGVYKVIERKCNGTELEINACNDISLLEFVKGNFYKIADSEIAFVVWSGNSDLTYSARKYTGKNVVESYPVTLVISDDEGFSEFLVLTAKSKGIYSFGKSNSADMSELTVVPISYEDLRGYTKEYPGND